MTEKILLVDDDPNILAAYKRNLRKQFPIEVAGGGEEGLEAIEEKGPFAVIIADMKMPGMDGIKFLTKVKEVAPDTVRMMLTGNADVQIAMNAVNKGNIFRFLTKPCQPAVLAVMLKAGIRQYRLINAEKELLEKTLRESIKVLVEILSLVNPGAFSRSSRIAPYVKYIAEKLRLSNIWQYELAAMLSHIGFVALPPEILYKTYNQKQLTAEEQKMWDSYPSVGSKLLAKISRLEPVARMIEDQQKPFEEYGLAVSLTEEETSVALGAQILKVTLDFDQLINKGFSRKVALSKLHKKPEIYNSQVVKALENFRVDRTEEVVKMVKVKELNTLMTINEDVWSRNGLLLISKGQEVTYPVLERLRNYAKRVGVVEPLRVRIGSWEKE